MPTKKFSLQRNGQKRLEVSWDRGYRNITVKIDGQQIGVIPDKEQLKTGKTFNFKDGKTLSLQLVSTWSSPQLQILLNGEPIPGSATDPQNNLDNAAATAYFVAVMSGLVGLLTVLNVEFFRDLQLDPLGLFMVAGIFVVLALNIKRGSKLALIFAILLFSLDTFTAAYANVQAGFSPINGVIGARIGLLVVLFNGFRVPRQYNKTKITWRTWVTAIGGMFLICGWLMGAAQLLPSLQDMGIVPGPTLTPSSTPFPTDTPIPPKPTLTPVPILRQEELPQLSFASDEDIFVIDSNGQMHNITHDREWNETFSWSPDGRQIAYTPTRGWLNIMDASGGSVRTLLKDDVSEAGGWSLDSSQILVVTNPGGSGQPMTLNVVDTRCEPLQDGCIDAIHELMTGDYYSEPQWSPDGKYITVLTRAGIMKMDPSCVNLPDSCRLTHLIDSIEPLYGEYSWSPDSTRLAVSIDGIITIVDVNSGSLQIPDRNLGRMPIEINDQKPVWSPDGSQIAFVSGRERYGERNSKQIFVMNIDGSNLRRVTNDMPRIQWLRWRPIIQ